MKKFRKPATILALIMVVILAVSSGCARKEEYALKVNGSIVTRQAYDAKFNAAKNNYAKQGVDFSSTEGKATLESIKQQVVDGLINTELIRQEVVKNKWSLTDPEVIKQVADFKAQQLQGQDYQKWLAEQGKTEQEVNQNYAFIVNVEKDVKVTDQEVQKYFKDNYAKYGGQEEQVKARHILVKTEQEALTIIKELQAKADFADLAKKKSTDTNSKDSGGELDYFTRGQMLPEFEEAAFSQKIGEISKEPVKTKYGYHIIQVEDHKDAVIPDFEKVKNSVRTDALNNAKNLKVQSYFSQLKQNAKIEYSEELKPKTA